MSDAPLDGYPVTIEIPVQWGDLDAFAHVNNTVYFRWFESARIAYFARIGFDAWKQEHGVGPILAATRCRFRIPLDYPDTVAIGARVPELGEDRFVMEYGAASLEHDQLAAEGDGLIVAYDYRAGEKTALPDTIRRRILALEGRGEPEPESGGSWPF